MASKTQITPPRVPIIDQETRYVSREWYRYFYSLYEFTGLGTGVLPITSGGTGTTDIPANGELLIGNGTGYDVNPLTAGAGVSVTNAAGAITLANTGVLSNVAGTGISVSSATGNVTVGNTGVLSNTAGNGVTVSSPTGANTISANARLIYGSFYSTENQADGSTTTAYPITLNNTAYSSNVTVVDRTAVFTASIGPASTNMTVSAITSGTIYPGMTITGTGVTAGTRIVSQTSGTAGSTGVYVVSVAQTVASTTITGTAKCQLTAGLAGLYNIQFSVQFVSTDASIHDTDIWFRKNGTDIAESNSQFSIPNRHAGVDGHLLGALNFFIDLAAGDYVEIMWATASSNVGIQYIGPQTSPTRPGTPSAIVTMALAAPPQLQGTYT
jgi:hypothetical protein